MTQPNNVTLNNQIVSKTELIDRIGRGEFLIIAADEQVLTDLPPGNWVAGTIPYFMTTEGGRLDQENAHITAIEGFDGRARPQLTLYDKSSISRIATEAPEHGFTFMLLPCGSNIHMDYAKSAPDYENMYFSPIVGWICGVNVADLASAKPKVGYGPGGGLLSEDHCVAVHIPLPEQQVAQINILNLFQQSDGPTITFENSGFSTQKATINGEDVDFVDFIKQANIDTRLPLVANYAGVMVNVSIKEVTDDGVEFYAPVFDNVEYKFAQPTGDYVEDFMRELKTIDTKDVAFSCNCILNYLYGELEGRSTGEITGPLTFGEVAYQLVNQTMVYLTIQEQ